MHAARASSSHVHAPISNIHGNSHTFAEKFYITSLSGYLARLHIYTHASTNNHVQNYSIINNSTSGINNYHCSRTQLKVDEPVIIEQKLRYYTCSDKFHTFSYHCRTHLMNNLHTQALFLLILACSNKNKFLYILKR